jgi:RNA polymerase sigma-70 factor (ECF subfamily)
MEQMPSHAPSPERLSLSSEIGRLLGPAMSQLSAQERAAFVLRHYEGCSIEEIGQALKVRPNAAKHSIFRAVQKLRRALEPKLGVTAGSSL